MNSSKYLAISDTRFLFWCLARVFLASLGCWCVLGAMDNNSNEKELLLNTSTRASVSSVSIVQKLDRAEQGIAPLYNVSVTTTDGRVVSRCISYRSFAALMFFCSREALGGQTQSEHGIPLRAEGLGEGLAPFFEQAPLQVARALWARWTRMAVWAGKKILREAVVSAGRYSRLGSYERALLRKIVWHSVAQNGEVLSSVLLSQTGVSCGALGNASQQHELDRLLTRASQAITGAQKSCYPEHASRTYLARYHYLLVRAICAQYGVRVEDDLEKTVLRLVNKFYKGSFSGFELAQKISGDLCRGHKQLALLQEPEYRALTDEYKLHVILQTVPDTLCALMRIAQNLIFLPELRSCKVLIALQPEKKEGQGYLATMVVYTSTKRAAQALAQKLAILLEGLAPFFDDTYRPQETLCRYSAPFAGPIWVTSGNSDHKALLKGVALGGLFNTTKNYAFWLRLNGTCAREHEIMPLPGYSVLPLVLDQLRRSGDTGKSTPCFASCMRPALRVIKEREKNLARRIGSLARVLADTRFSYNAEHVFTYA
jgi:hypothetical protein